MPHYFQDDLPSASFNYDDLVPNIYEVDDVPSTDLFRDDLPSTSFQDDLPSTPFHDDDIALNVYDMEDIATTNSFKDDLSSSSASVCVARDNEQDYPFDSAPNDPIAPSTNTGYSSLVYDYNSDDTDFDGDGDGYHDTYVYCVEPVDPVAYLLHDLIKQGVVDTSKIFYRYVRDVLESLKAVSKKKVHEYDTEVLEFFNSISYLGGQRVTNFIRGPMNIGKGTNSGSVPRINLGGPSQRTCDKRQAGYTNNPGVIKSLILANYDLLLKSSASPLIESNKFVVYPCALANDGTSLKPSIEFDERLKTNVGLLFNVDFDYITENPVPDPHFLDENIVTEALVSSITSLDNEVSLPCAVEYSAKKGKTGEAMFEMFTRQVKVVQLCMECVKKGKFNENIITDDGICTSSCKTCIDTNELCMKCKADGQIDIHPQFRRCYECIKDDRICIKRAVLVLTGDCESGNKAAYEMIRSKIVDGNIDQDLFYLSALPDVPHVTKSLKGSLKNWWLVQENERANLSQLVTLRNRSDRVTMELMKNFIPKNDHIKNKDRQDPSSVVTLTNLGLITYLQNVGLVVKTIIPELDEFSTDNVAGIYHHPFSICLGRYGTFYFLCLDDPHGKAVLYHARLHNPVDNIKLVSKDANAKSVQYCGGAIFLLLSDGRIKVKEETRLIFDFTSISEMKPPTKSKLKSYASNVGLILNDKDTVKDMLSKFTKRVAEVSKEYSEAKRDPAILNHFSQNGPGPLFIESFYIPEKGLIYVADRNSKTFITFNLTTDGVGVRLENRLEIASYTANEEVLSMTVNCGKLYFATKKQVSMITLENGTCQTVVQSDDRTIYSLAPYENSIVFTDELKHSLYFVNDSGTAEILIGTEKEGARDGPALTCQLMQPISVCVEFGQVLYICDAQSNSIKIASPMKGCAEYLRQMSMLSKAFRMHAKGGKRKLSSMTVEQALELVKDAVDSLKANEQKLRSICTANVLEG